MYPHDTSQSVLPELSGYEFLKLLGQGSGGSVYLARQLALGRLVAVKNVRPLIPSRGNQALVKRFRREARTMSHLEHPNIVSVLDFVSEGNNFYLVLEYVGGPTLREVQPYLSRPTALYVLSQMAAAIGYASSRGIAHRDIKPENVLLTPSGQSKLTDFGIAKVFSGTAYGGQLSAFSTEAGDILGTMAYISPEAASGRGRIDHRADLYGLAVVAYELLVGRLPFPPKSDFYSTLLAHATEPVPRPTTVVPGFPSDVETVLLRALEKQPDRRQRDVGVFWSDLRRSASRAWPDWERQVNIGELRPTVDGATSTHNAARADTAADDTIVRPPRPHSSTDAPPERRASTDHRPTIVSASIGTSEHATRPGPATRPDSPVKRPRRHTRPMRVLIAALAFAFAGILAAVLVSQRGSASHHPPLSVDALNVTVDQPSNAGHCPQAQFMFRSTIDTNGGAGQVRFQWIYPNSVPGPIDTANVSYDTKQVVETLQYSYSGGTAASGAAVLHVLSPTDQYSSPAPIVYRCP